LNVKEGTSYDSGVITIAVPGYDDGSSGGTPTPPPTPSASNAKYTVTRVRGTKKPNNSPEQPDDGRVYFDLDNLTSSSDATVRQTYFADITVRVFDANAPAGLGVSDIVMKSGVTTVDMGSFSYAKNGAGRSIEMVQSSDGYFEIAFKGLRYSGNNKQLSFRIKKDGYVGDVYADISECITKKEAAAENNGNHNNNNNDDDDSKLEVETPYVIVSKYSYGGGSVTAGDTFPLSMTFYNTSETEIVSNMMITITVPDGLMLTSSSNTFYVDELEKHASITKSVKVTAKADAKPQSHNIGVAMKYQYVDDRVNTRRSAETTENIAVPVVQVDRFQVTGVEVPMEVMLGEETSVTVNFVNKGRSEAYNLSTEIDGNIQNPGQNQNLGNLASGAAGTADFYIMPTEVGMCTGEIKITYEDTNMQEKVATIRYNTTVKSPEEFAGNMGMGGMMPGMMPGMDGGEMPMEEKPKSKLPLIIGGGVIVAVPALIVIKKKLDAKKKEKEDADL
ncbi:MAG: hypothetical protein RR049_01340, partial [Angelakisella sp.]